jgi:hypothetical protein
MATPAQIAANKQNAQHSTGAQTDAGKEASKMNNFRHGLTGHAFILLDFESAEEFDELKAALTEEHNPQTPTEQILVEKMAQHHWLSQRAQFLQTFEMKDNLFSEDAFKAVNTYIRYQAHHERLFQRALKDLLTLRGEKRKEQIGFESQKRAEAAEQRKQAGETRKQEHHKVTMAIAETRLEREKSNAIIRAIAAANKMEDVLGPQMDKIAA